MHLRSDLPYVHQHAAHHRRPQPAPERAQAFFPRDAHQPPRRVRVVLPVAGGPRAVGAHAHEDHLGRVPDDPREPSRGGGAEDGRPGRQRAALVVVVVAETLAEDGEETEAGGGVGGLAEDGGGEAGPEGRDSCDGVSMMLRTQDLCICICICMYR